MGQQQLLLIVLVTIVIGIASLVAVTTFDSAAQSANRDALTIDISTLASSAQDYFLRPESLNGGSRSFDGFIIRGKLLPVSGISEDGLFAQTENGTLEVFAVAGSSITIIGHPSSCEGYQPGTVDGDGILATPGNCSEANQISATVGRREIVFE
ncbi:hypothetical protein [Rhodohalobacter sp. 8-1]|uniref:hypothetical protein n=1 Tax=Rhodohalobacter sp. 8-1 TaxID=3131972 RepID=UPI0030EE6D7E